MDLTHTYWPTMLSYSGAPPSTTVTVAIAKSRLLIACPTRLSAGSSVEMKMAPVPGGASLQAFGRVVAYHEHSGAPADPLEPPLPCIEVTTAPNEHLDEAISRELLHGSTRKRVVAIDDEAVHLRTMHALVGGLGFVPICVTGPMGATNIVARVSPVLVVLDYNMPGVDGRQLCKLLRGDKRTRDIPIVFYSAADPKKLETVVADTGAKGFISKGSDIMSVRARLAGYLGV